MLRLGMLDFDTSHVVAFAQRLHHVGVKPDQFVDGAKIVIACPGESKLSPERIPGFRKEIAAIGIPLTDDPKSMIGKVDGMLIEAVDGSVHLERARPFLEAGIPCYIDKPFACSLKDALAIVELADKKKLPLMSCSSLRYAPELAEFVTKAERGKTLGALTYGPASLHPRNPGLFHYGIHAVEILYTLMGAGCSRVTAIYDKDVDLVTGHWKDGRVASVRGIRAGQSAYGATVFSEKGVQSLTIGTGLIYRELLKKIVCMFQTGKSPIDIRETLEIVAFIESANQSAANHGAGVSIRM
ncbi:Gfo/Idh/MocA family protein [Tuwongella immobilis]|uniref:Oxidoreductase domain protein n=1 Tax=Tuwongella immobilis TaxID=692036 RepID=A0A6C2YUD0_9BACT|nr:Gfo/Idh/MocA family oxidoreductase [Tuwongella immobilis]VIP04472.1 Oxidoreductase domain protein OS=Isosphaera pallida (strain ATCC 43644 / DSM 9630 / IS1B) GN=Isop_2920 PE=4 SV=1 [Tuwongella immobilis]VTS06306.1 Oxidoreductase domain protein OS=Isosphaera pallida (strain ATCC 43644 / DSM 9630 / IS1B) GN=Isop_2920 PE=4 SV=1 [Tuwongella immobilis]